MRLTMILLCCVLVALSSSIVRAGFVVEVELQAQFPQPGTGGFQKTTFGDMDGDGNLETFVYVYDSPHPYRVLHVESGTTQEISGFPLGFNSDFHTFADVDGDAQSELVMSVSAPDLAPRILVIGWDGQHSSSSPEPLAQSGSSLARVAPNPTPGACRVSFSVPQSGRVSAILFDVAGRQVRKLLSGNYPAGDYSPLWDGRDDAGREVVAGVYLVKVTTPAGETGGRVVLTR